MQRQIGHLKGKSEGPTVIFFAGIHGNEPAGVFALQEVFSELKGQENELFGEFIGVAGNLKALKKQVRFLEEDLNRIWQPHRLGSFLQNKDEAMYEAEELVELFGLIQQVIANCNRPIYFIDLHTTSGETEPFIVMNDSLLNRRFAKNFPFPVILGIEEYLNGALLSQINEMGYVSIGFESGQHHSEEAIANAKYFIRYTLALVGITNEDHKTLLNKKSHLGRANNGSQQFYEIYYQHLIGDNPSFKMLPGFANFQSVPKGIAFAMNGDGLITTTKKRKLFMPLYQDKGDEGFYFIRGIPNFFLALSKYLRKLALDRCLSLLPGITWTSSRRESMVVNRKVARFFAKSFFHLFGYRTREIDTNHLVLKSRERNSKTLEYRRAKWY
ncbi:succinylglutamate desuccinylase/aspartoacylase family protein [Croceivirga thetidis]|uniref:Aspartoacylase n=1 Tax=Croceivirga thetidis TaxID=2721623 RepID=A0ABX1GNM9_9FLAO|nr:succinylglutamate desuccinylase/aspartoacylase family protein [Croceivirga thetidis]NKI31278.1 aspartoacylase [Croceivirga thetidis]